MQHPILHRPLPNCGAGTLERRWTKRGQRRRSGTYRKTIAILNSRMRQWRRGSLGKTEVWVSLVPTLHCHLHHRVDCNPRHTVSRNRWPHRRSNRRLQRQQHQQHHRAQCHLQHPSLFRRHQQHLHRPRSRQNCRASALTRGRPPPTLSRSHPRSRAQGHPYKNRPRSCLQSCRQSLTFLRTCFRSNRRTRTLVKRRRRQRRWRWLR